MEFQYVIGLSTEGCTKFPNICDIPSSGAIGVGVLGESFSHTEYSHVANQMNVRKSGMQCKDKFQHVRTLGYYGVGGERVDVLTIV